MRDFREIIERAAAEHKPSKRFVMFSGGNDSMSLLHMVWKAGLCDAAVHINTGAGIPETHDFVVAQCARYGIPLLEYAPLPGKTYRDLVLKFGFPGPGGHMYPYRWLKERQIERLVRDHKTHFGDRIMLITGVRLSESQRRMGNVEEIVRRGAQLWVAPILDWTKDDLRAYREREGVPESDVAALLHMSGECLCGAFAKPDEMRDLEAFFPATARRIHALENEAREVGKHAVWGTRPPRHKKTAGGMLCVGCEFGEPEAVRA